MAFDSSLIIVARALHPEIVSPAAFPFFRGVGDFFSGEAGPRRLNPDAKNHLITGGFS
jgi:hypothetical protein